MPTRISRLHDADGEVCGVLGVVDSDARHGHAARHLGGGEQRVKPVQGTPITGRSVSEAAKPGRAADSPAPAMTTRKPFVRAFLTSSAVRSGCRCADETWNSYETPALLNTSKAGSILGLSLSDPTRISTSATHPSPFPLPPPPPAAPAARP